MPAILRVGIDSAGGLITGVLNTSVTVNGTYVVLNGAAVASHGTGAHANAHMIASKTDATIGGIAICHAGDIATCGHVGGPGSTNSSSA